MKPKVGKNVQAHLEVIVLIIVHEFYANAIKREIDYVFVWGKKASFCRSTINKFFTLNDLEIPKYIALINEDFVAK